MIQAVFGSKSKNYAFDEDILTSTVLGMLKYLRPDIGVIPFIEAAFLYNQKRTQMWEKLNDEGIVLRNYHLVEYVFWPKHEKFGEPDLILIFSDHVHHEKDFLIVIEVKFKSGKSSMNSNDQLAKYLEAVGKEEELEKFSDPQIANFKGKKGYLIYLTEAEAHKDITESSNILQSKNAVMKERIFHLRWHQLYKTLETAKLYCSTNENTIIEDLMQYLEALGLKDFSGILAPDENLTQLFSSDFLGFYHNVK